MARHRALDPRERLLKRAGDEQLRAEPAEFEQVGGQPCPL